MQNPAETTPQKFISKPPPHTNELTASKGKQTADEIIQEMKNDGSLNPFPYFYRRIMKEYYEEHPNEKSVATVSKEYDEWLAQLKEQYETIKQNAANERVDKGSNDTKTVVITAAQPKKWFC